MNRNEETTGKLLQDKQTLHPDWTNDESNSSLSLKTVAETTFRRMSKANQSSVASIDKTSNKKNRKMSVEDLRKEAQNAILSSKHKQQKRTLGLKRLASPSPTIQKDVCYKTIHPSKIDIKSILVVDSGRKKSKQAEVSKQGLMIKSQAQEVTTKKYQLIHSDLHALLRSASETNVTAESPPVHSTSNSSSNSNNGSPQRAVPTSA